MLRIILFSITVALASFTAQAQECLMNPTCTVDDFKDSFYSSSSMESFLNNHQKMILEYPENFFEFFNSQVPTTEEMHDLIGYLIRNAPQEVIPIYHQQDNLKNILTNYPEMYCQIIRNEYEIAKQLHQEDDDFPDQEILSRNGFNTAFFYNLEFFANLNESERKVECSGFTLNELYLAAREREGNYIENQTGGTQTDNKKIQTSSRPQNSSHLEMDESFLSNGIKYSIKTEIKNCSQAPDIRNQISSAKLEFKNEFIESRQKLKFDQKLYLSQSPQTTEDDACHFKFTIYRVN